MESVKTEYQLVKREYFNATLYSMFVMDRARLFLIWAVLFAAAIYVFMLATGTAELQSIPSILFVLIALYSVYRYFSLRKAVDAYAEREDSFIGRGHFLTLDESSLYLSVPLLHKRVHVDYSKLVQVCETSELFLIFPDRQSCYILPKHALPVGTITPLRERLHQQMGKRFVSRYVKKDYEALIREKISLLKRSFNRKKGV